MCGGGNPKIRWVTNRVEIRLQLHVFFEKCNKCLNFILEIAITNWNLFDLFNFDIFHLSVFRRFTN